MDILHIVKTWRHLRSEQTAFSFRTNELATGRGSNYEVCGPGPRTRQLSWLKSNKQFPHAESENKQFPLTEFWEINKSIRMKRQPNNLCRQTNILCQNRKMGKKQFPPSGCATSLQFCHFWSLQHVSGNCATLTWGTVMNNRYLHGKLCVNCDSAVINKQKRQSHESLKLSVKITS